METAAASPLWLGDKPARRAAALVTLAAAVGDSAGGGLPGVLTAVLGAAPARPRIAVTIDTATLLGLAQHPGELTGYGPIPAPLARVLAADGTWARFVTDPGTGHLLDATPYRYTPSDPLRAHVTARDLTCRHPGCAHAATTCDLDHTDPYQPDPHQPDAHQPDPQQPDPQQPEDPRGGTTTRANLAARCRRHHNLKTWHGWHTTTSKDGTITHRSPLGRTYHVPIPPQPTTHAA